MEVQINWLAVLLAGLSSMVVGMIYYAKPIFGDSWQKLVKLDDSKMKTGMAPAMAKSIIASLVTAYVLAHVTYLSSSFFVDTSFEAAAITTAFWLWLGIAATTIVVHDAFEQRPMKLTAMNAGNQLLTLLAMGLIIGQLGV